MLQKILLFQMTYVFLFFCFFIDFGAIRKHWMSQLTINRGIGHLYLNNILTRQYIIISEACYDDCLTHPQFKWWWIKYSSSQKFCSWADLHGDPWKELSKNSIKQRCIKSSYSQRGPVLKALQIYSDSSAALYIECQLTLIPLST